MRSDRRESSYTEGNLIIENSDGTTVVFNRPSSYEEIHAALNAVSTKQDATKISDSKSNQEPVIQTYSGS